MSYRDRYEERSSGIKVCTRCGRSYPNTREHFHKNKQTGDGLHYYCKECRRKEKSKWLNSKPEKRRLYYRTQKEKNNARSL